MFWLQYAARYVWLGSNTISFFCNYTSQESDAPCNNQESNLDVKSQIQMFWPYTEWALFSEFMFNLQYKARLL